MRYNIIIAGLLLTLVFFQYRLWFEPGGMRELQKLKVSLAKQTQENERLKQRNKELLFQIQGLRESHDAAEARARNELGMIKKGELFYQIVGIKGNGTNENSNQ